MAEVIPQETPNPQAYKFTIEGHTFDAPVSVSSREEAEGTPFSELFDIPGVASVFATANFVTLTKEPAADWGPLVGPAREVLERNF